VDAVFEHLFGAKRPEWEADIAHALGEKSIADWLRSPTGFFADHLGRYSKSRRVAPIYWPITTPSGGITFWVYAPRLDHGTLPGIINQLRADMEPLRNERDRLKAAGNGDRAQGLRALQLARDCAERQALHDALSALVTRGFAPHPDDGFVVTASPLYATFRLAKWRELLRETFASLEKGDLDWAHLAMRFRPKQVREKCKTDSSLAIAHGLESACAPVRKQGRKKVSPPQARAVQPSGSAAMKQEELIPRAGSKGARWSG
jgi:hypothetical protein